MICTLRLFLEQRLTEHASDMLPCVSTWQGRVSEAEVCVLVWPSLGSVVKSLYTCVELLELTHLCLSLCFLGPTAPFLLMEVSSESCSASWFGLDTIVTTMASDS